MNIQSLDELDKKILSLLLSNARMPYLTIAKKCNLTGAAIHRRITKLQKDKIITGSQLNINPKYLGYTTYAFIGLQINLTSLSSHEEVFKKISMVPEVIECYHITGKYSLFIKVFAKSNEDLKKIIVQKIQSIIEITSTETFICLEEGFRRQLPFDI